jgi:hypothetical protein
MAHQALRQRSGRGLRGGSWQRAWASAALLTLVAGELAACEKKPAPEEVQRAVQLTALTLAAAPGSSLPNLRTAADGSVLVSWTEPVVPAGTAGSAQPSSPAAAHALRWAELSPSGFGPPATVATGTDWLINWADFPSVTRLGPRTLLAHWLRKRKPPSGKGMAGYDIELTRSDDGGGTWSLPWRPHGDDTETEHGFVSVVPRGQGGALVLWLDGRAFAGLDEEGAEQRASMALRYAVLEPSAGGGDAAAPAVDTSLELDPRTCSCCQTAAVATGDAVLVAYRDRSADEIRDIAVTRFAGGRWSAPALVHADGWHIDGCPVNGPALAARGQRVAVAWYTAAGERPQVKLALSEDGGVTFGAPVRIDQGNPQGRVDVALAGELAVVSWQELAGPVVELRVRAVDLRGATPAARASQPIAAVAAGRVSGFPQLAVQGGDAILVWTNADAGGKTAVAAARIALSALR